MTTQLTLPEPEAPAAPRCPECGGEEHDEWGLWQRADGVWVCQACGLRPETEEKRDAGRP
jgi:ribosomal protein L37AE/L43A